MNQQKIIIGCLKNNQRSQRLLVDTYSDLLYAICIRYMGDLETAKDALQISFLKILQNMEKYDSKKGKLESWISTITINTCLSILRKNRAVIVDLDNVNSEDISVSEVALEDMAAEEILGVVAGLPILHREIFNLIVIDGYSHVEVASMLEIKEEPSRSRLSRAKKMLRKLLSNTENKKSWASLG